MLLIIILVFLTYKAWQMLPQFTIRSDGFMSMLSYNQKSFWVSTSYPLASIVLSEMILGAILPKLFGVHLSYYYWLELIILMTIAAMFYVALKAITKNSFVAFSASIMSAVSYFGVYDMVSTHCYCFFLERVVPVIFLIPSFLFLHLYLEKNKNKYLISSLFLYFLGVGLGHFTLLIFPAFFLYPLFWKFFKEKTLRKKLEGFVYGFLYVILTGFFYGIQQINESGISPHNWTFVEFLFNPQKFLYMEKIGLQYVYWSQYPGLLKDFTQNPMSYIIDHRIAGSYISIAIIAYLLAAYAIYKHLPKQRPMLFTTLLGLPVIFYLNAYIGQYDILYQPGASRYLYFPTFLLAIFWSYFIWAVFWRNKKSFIAGGFLVLGGYYFVNAWLINGNAIYSIEWNKSTRTIFDHVISTRENVLPNTLIVVTYPEFGSQESGFFTDQIGKGKVRYISDNNLVNIPYTWENVSSSFAHVIKLRYDKNCSCVIEEKIK